MSRLLDKPPEEMTAAELAGVLFAAAENPRHISQPMVKFLLQAALRLDRAGMAQAPSMAEFGAHFDTVHASRRQARRSLASPRIRSLVTG